MTEAGQIKGQSGTRQAGMVFVGLSAILLLMGWAFSPFPAALWQGYKIILTHPSTLDFDALQQAGHFGAAFFNAGLLLAVVLVVYRITKTDLNGAQIAAAMMVVGFSFYGKNILNIWFPIIGVLLQAKLSHIEISRSTALAFFSTALSPVFSVSAFGTEALTPGSPQAVALGVVLGVLAGVLTGYFATHLPVLHKNYVLFNAGFAAGLAGMVVNALKRAVGLGHDRYPYIESAQAAAEGIRADFVTGQNTPLGLTLLVLFCYLLAAGLLLGGGRVAAKMFWARCKGGDFVAEHGIAPCLVNMGVMGLISLAYVLILPGAQLSGPIFSCIFTAAGFAAAGVSVRMFLPTMAGVCFTAFLTGGIAGVVAGGAFLPAALAKVSSRSMLLAAVFSCGLAPIVYDFGAPVGFFVGMVHCILVPNTAVLHGWMSLYNNGFSLSLIATFFYPIYELLGRRMMPKKE